MLWDKRSVELLAMALRPEEDSGRLGKEGIGGEVAAPIVQFLSNDGCFLCVSWGFGESPEIAPIRDVTVKSFAEFCRE